MDVTLIKLLIDVIRLSTASTEHSTKNSARPDTALRHAHRMASQAAPYGEIRGRPSFVSAGAYDGVPLFPRGGVLLGPGPGCHER